MLLPAMSKLIENQEINDQLVEHMEKHDILNSWGSMGLGGGNTLKWPWSNLWVILLMQWRLGSLLCAA